jgi:hypothetical protein
VRYRGEVKEICPDTVDQTAEEAVSPSPTGNTGRISILTNKCS